MLDSGRREANPAGRHVDHIAGAEQGGVRPAVGVDRRQPQRLGFRQEVGSIEIARHSTGSSTVVSRAV